MPSESLTTYTSDIALTQSDTISAAADSVGIVGELVLNASAADVYGPASSLATQVRTISRFLDNTTITGNVLFQLMVAGLFIAYCYLIYYYRQDVIALLKVLKSKLFRDKLLDDQNHLYTQFLNVALTLGVLAMGIGCVTLAEIFTPPELLHELPEWVVAVICPAVLAVFGGIILYRILILKIIGKITLNVHFTNTLVFYRKMITVLGVVLITPTLLLLATNDSPSREIIAYVLAGECLLWIIYLIFKTYRFFIEQNVSILHWFLYLCGIEIFPISVLVFLTMRNTL